MINIRKISTAKVPLHGTNTHMDIIVVQVGVGIICHFVKLMLDKLYCINFLSIPNLSNFKYFYINFTIF